MSGEAAGLRELAEKATPGPWYIVGPPWNSEAPYVVAGSSDPHVAQNICDGGCVNANPNEWDDMPFIAAANPETVLALLDVAEAAKEAQRELNAETQPSIERGWENATHALDAALSRLEAMTGGACADR